MDDRRQAARQRYQNVMVVVSDGVTSSVSKMQASGEAIKQSIPAPKIPDTVVTGSATASDSIEALRVLSVDVSTGLSRDQIPKVGRVCRRMKEAGYKGDDIDKVVRSLFVTQSERDFSKAFRVFDKAGNGFLEAQSFKAVLPMLGEDVPPQQFDDMFRAVDQDQSGKIELEEFIALMKATNPMGEVGDRRDKARQRMAGALGFFKTSNFSGVGGNLSENIPNPMNSETMKILSCLSMDVTAGLGPSQYPAVTRIVTNMQAAGYPNPAISRVIKTMFLSQSDQDFAKTFKVFDVSNKGKLERAEFQKTLAMLGEDVPQEELQLLFDEVDVDRSGTIELPEFSRLLKAMNPLDSDMQRRERARQRLREAPGQAWSSILSTATSAFDSVATIASAGLDVASAGYNAARTKVSSVSVSLPFGNKDEQEQDQAPPPEEERPEATEPEPEAAAEPPASPEVAEEQETEEPPAANTPPERPLLDILRDVPTEFERQTKLNEYLTDRPNKVLTNTEAVEILGAFTLSMVKARVCQDLFPRLDENARQNFETEILSHAGLSDMVVSNILTQIKKLK
eukprot:c6179_g1_i1.p1 GENE.c6179_g1_i1~~c6179_g1_i1.p1  ORF type:complete len:582 (+),score=123.73 c6179_g1_i1:46-1746(+)